MQKLLSMIIAGLFAAVSVSAFAADAAKKDDSGAIDPSTRELRPGDILRYTLEEDPIKGKEFIPI